MADTIEPRHVVLRTRRDLAGIALAACFLTSPLLAADAPSPDFIGRFDQARRFAWPGSSIVFRFRGTRLAVRLQDGGRNSLEAIVDGRRSRLRLHEGAHTYVLAQGLAAAEHEVALVRRTDSLVGPTKFIGYQLSGRLLPRPAPRRRLLAIGDSITSGYGIDGPPGVWCPFDPNEENAFLAYPMVAARSVGADVHVIAWTGAGLARNFDGSDKGTMPEKYNLAIPDEAGIAWDPGLFQPDAVIVNLGANDFQIDLDPDRFAAAYVAFLAKLRADYPRARIYVAVGPMIPAPRYSIARAAIAGTVAARAAAGDRNIALIDFGDLAGRLPLRCGHPDAGSHATIAGKWVAALRADLNW